MVNGPSGLLTSLVRPEVDKTIVSFMRIRLIIFFLFSAGYFAQAQASASVDDGPDNINTLLVVGDSLSAGRGLELEDTWVTLLDNRLQQEGYGYKVVNASISGDTTGNGRRRLSRALNIHQPDIVIIELGGNDGLRGLPIEVMQKNLEQMIIMTQDLGALPILAGIQIPPSYGEEYTTEFAAVYPALAEQYETPLIPFFMENIVLDSSMMQADGIHPNETAQPILEANVWKILSKALPTVSAGPAPPRAPQISAK